MTETWDPLANIVSPTELSGAVVEGTVQHTVGNIASPAINYDYAALNSALPLVADIDAPSSWANLVALTGGPMAVKILGDDPITLSVGVGNHYLRLQVLIDGVVIWNVKVGKGSSGTNTVRAVMALPYYYCQSTFTIRAARNTTLASSAGTYIKVGVAGGIHYEYVQKIS